jgi:ferredoxin-NADP reductase
VAAEGVVVLDLVATGGGALPPWAPGAHIDLLLDDGLIRQYSLCGDPADRSVWRVGVLLDPAGRGGSGWVHRHLVEDVEVAALGPRNHFPLLEAGAYVFVAGGIGVTPILPMVRAASRAGAPWEMHYGGRCRTSLAFVDELATLPGGQLTLYPQDEVGLIDVAGVLGRPRPETLVYCCGPGALLDAVERQCATWATGTLHLERFAPADPSGTTVPSAFTVELARTGRTLDVPADRSLLDAVTDAGIPVLSSCHEGTCGTCETAVLAGVVDHRDSVLTPGERAANDTMLICVSRAAGPGLVLDL